MEKQFHDEWNTPLDIYLVDDLTKNVWEQAGLLKNYTGLLSVTVLIISMKAEKLKTLSGRAMHKKKI